jgi:hypothetical protein
MIIILAVYWLTGMIVLHVLEVYMPPPPRYPDLYPALFSLYGAASGVVVFVIVIGWLGTRPTASSQSSSSQKEKKIR